MSKRIGDIRFNVRCFAIRFPDQLAEMVAHKLPRRLVYFATIRAFSKAWADAGTKMPDELTFTEVVNPWYPVAAKVRSHAPH